jgi:MFS family permease
MARAAFVNRNFTLLLTGKVVSQLGDKVYGIALAWWMLEKTGSTALMGLMMALSVLPGIVLGAFVGPLLDHWNPKAVLVLADSARAVVTGLVAVLQALGLLSPLFLLVSAVAISLASAFFDPTAQAIVPRLVPSAERPRANSLSQMSGGLSMVAGPVLGALGVAAIGYVPVFAANAASYLFSAVMESLIRLAPAPESARHDSFRSEFKEGLDFLRRDKRLVKIVIVVGLAHFFVGDLLVCQPVMARNIGHAAGVGALGILQCATGGGMILGALAAGLIRGASLGEGGLYARIAFLGAVFLGLGASATFAPGGLVAPAALILAYGAIQSQAAIFWSTILQERVPQGLAGRVFSIVSLAGNASMPLAYAVVGILAGLLPVNPILTGSGFVLMAAAIAFSRNTCEQKSPPML